MSMGDTVITVVAIILAFILMFAFPLMSISERNDDIAQLTAHTAVVEFVDNVRSTGKITLNEYDDFIQTLSATGNSYDVEMEVRVLDENPGKKDAQSDGTKIGENVYYSVFSTQIEEVLKSYSAQYQYKLKEGDMIIVKIKNTNTTIAQMLKNFFYSITGNDTYSIEASHSGIVLTTGK